MKIGRGIAHPQRSAGRRSRDFFGQVSWPQKLWGDPTRFSPCRGERAAPSFPASQTMQPPKAVPETHLPEGSIPHGEDDAMDACGSRDKALIETFWPWNKLASIAIGFARRSRPGAWPGLADTPEQRVLREIRELADERWSPDTSTRMRNWCSAAPSPELSGFLRRSCRTCAAGGYGRC